MIAGELGRLRAAVFFRVVDNGVDGRKVRGKDADALAFGAAHRAMALGISGGGHQAGEQAGGSYFSQKHVILPVFPLDWMHGVSGIRGGPRLPGGKTGLAVNPLAGLAVKKVAMVGRYGDRNHVADLGAEGLVGPHAHEGLAEAHGDHRGIAQKLQRVDRRVDLSPTRDHLRVLRTKSQGVFALGSRQAFDTCIGGGERPLFLDIVKGG